MNDSHHKQGASRIRTGAGLCMLVAALAVGSPVLADDDHHRGRWYGHGEDHRHDRGHRHCRRDRHPHVSYSYYQQPAPVVVYREQPVIVERVVERVVVEQPAYPVYGAPAPNYGGGYGAGNPNRVVTAAMLGAAGGLLGSQVGRGDGRVAATAAGAVAGWVLGSNLGR